MTVTIHRDHTTIHTTTFWALLDVLHIRQFLKALKKAPAGHTRRQQGQKIEPVARTTKGGHGTPVFKVTSRNRSDGKHRVDHHGRASFKKENKLSCQMGEAQAE